MSFLSQLVMAFIIFGAVAATTIGILVALLVNREEESHAAAPDQHQDGLTQLE